MAKAFFIGDGGIVDVVVWQKSEKLRKCILVHLKSIRASAGVN